MPRLQLLSSESSKQRDASCLSGEERLTFLGERAFSPGHGGWSTLAGLILNCNLFFVLVKIDALL